MKSQSHHNKKNKTTAIEQRYPNGFWDKAGDYLDQCFILQHNQDYLEFLVKQVWKLIQPVALVEFGCGSGKMGIQLLPLLSEGSTYTGIDQSNDLISRGREILAGMPWQSNLHEGSIYQTPFEDSCFDVSLVHTVLMHVPHPKEVLKEMIRLTKPGGLVIACEANRNAHTALLHIEEVNHQELVPLELFQTINREIRKRSGVDHNIGIKMPVIMHKAGLQNIQSRLSDAVRFLYPPLDTAEKEILFKAICDEGYGQAYPTEEQLKRWKENLMGFGISEQAAENEIAREIEEDFLNRGNQYHTIFASVLVWTFGVVPGTK